MNAPMPPQAVTVARLPLAQISPSPTNPRKHFDEAYLAELAETIKAHDVLQPITVRPNPRGVPLYEIVVGECRWRAAKLAGLVDIPAFWRELDDKQVLEIQVIENLQRKDISEIEEAEGYDQLIKRHGYKVEQLAEKIGKSRAYVYARLKLTALCRDARDAFYADKLDASTALLIARIPSEALQKKATKAITESYSGDPMSYRMAKSHIRHHFTTSLQHATFPLGDSELVPVAGSCDACPKRSGNDPELFSDLDDADVCTDTQCFDDKRAARHLQLIERAEQRKIPVLKGEAVNAIVPGGWLGNMDRDRHVSLDDEIDDDADGRTYRELLGDAAPVAVVLELGQGTQTRLVEVAETKAIEQALKKAGWKPAEQPQETPRKETSQQRAERERHETERQARAKAVEAENAWRQDLAAALWPKLREACTHDIDLSDHMTRRVAMAWLRQEAAWNQLPEELLDVWGITLPAEYDEAEEIAKIEEVIADWPVGDVLTFLLQAFTEAERRPLYPYNSFEPEHDRPQTLLALANAVGIDAEALRAPKVQPETTTSDDRVLQIGDRVRIKDGLKGPGGKRRKCCGREGVIEIVVRGGESYFVRTGPDAVVGDLERRDLEKLPAETASPPTMAAQAESENAAVAAPANAKGTKAKKAAGKKGNEDSETAPAAPADEPATPVAQPTRFDDRMAWPFPVGARP